MISVGASAKIQMRSGEIIDLGTETKDAFYYETKEFLTLIEEGKLESKIMSHKFSLELMKILDEIRCKINLVYEADKV